MNYKSFNLGDWIGHISGAIEDYRELDGNEMRDLVEFLSTLDRKPCDDVVSREAVIALAKNDCETAIIPYKRFVKDVNTLPPVTLHPKMEGWIPVSRRLPECEQKVLVLALHRNSNYVITTGMYEDGSLPECDSMWNWEEVNYEKWDDENDCGIIPEGWFEYHEYNPDGILNYAIEDKVVAWMPLPKPYKAESEDKECK